MFTGTSARKGWEPLLSTDLTKHIETNLYFVLGKAYWGEVDK